MSRSTFALFVGVFSVSSYMLMTIFVFCATFIFDAIKEAVVEDGDLSTETEEAVEAFSDYVHYYVFVELFYYFIMFIASMCLVYGVKQQSHRYIAPWVYLTIFGVIFECLDFFVSFGDYESSEHVEFVSIVTIVLSALFWYPIFSYYRELKHPKAVVATTPCAVPAYVSAPEYSHATAKFVPTSVAVC